jgi:3-hydroxyisobutyrate dehydrogenase-like beta-hydroxyacid dehydrogenase
VRGNGDGGGVNEDDKAVTVLGLGAMGTALAGAFLAIGRRTTVWNRTAGKAGELVERGAVEAAGLEAAIRASPLVVACLLDHHSVHEALDPLADALAGRTLVNLTNGTPSQGRELAAWASGHGAEFLDGGIMAPPPMIGSPEAFVFYSGPRETFDAHHDVLHALGEARYMGADPGLAALHDLALLSGMYGMYGGILHAFALIRSTGVAATEFAPLLRHWTEGMGDLVDSIADQIDSGDYAGDVVSTLAMQATAYPNLLEVAREQGVSSELIAPLYPLMRRRMADGHGHEDLTGVIELLRIEGKTND